MDCKVGSCSQPVLDELRDLELCLEHYLTDLQERIRHFAHQLAEAPSDEPLRQTALQFIVLSAAKIANIGIQNPPDEQLRRGQLLHAMLLLADLRETLDKAAKKPAS